MNVYGFLQRSRSRVTLLWSVALSQRSINLHRNVHEHMLPSSFAMRHSLVNLSKMLTVLIHVTCATPGTRHFTFYFNFIVVFLSELTMCVEPSDQCDGQKSSFPLHKCDEATGHEKKLSATKGNRACEADCTVRAGLHCMFWSWSTSKEALWPLACSGEFGQTKTRLFARGTRWRRASFCHCNRRQTSPGVFFGRTAQMSNFLTVFRCF